MIRTWQEYHTTIVVIAACVVFVIGSLVAIANLSVQNDPNPDCSGKHGGIVGPPTYTRDNSTLYYTCKDGTVIQKP